MRKSPKSKSEPMSNSLKFNTLLLVLIFSLILCSCTPTPSGTGNIPPEEEGDLRLTEEGDKIAVFSEGYPDGFWARNDKGNGHPFNCSFQRSNAVVADGLLTLSLTKSGDGYVGAEYRTQARYSYGYYSVSMKAARCPGVISSFFTYTGWPWDEIDIEFLGDDTTRVQFNYYTDGKGDHEYVYELGFDAADDFHEYGFYWQSDSITWYVDGVPVYRATEDIPSHAGHIMMNLWNVADTNADWAGKFDEDQLPVRAQYRWVAVSLDRSTYTGYKSAE